MANQKELCSKKCKWMTGQYNFDYSEAPEKLKKIFNCSALAPWIEMGREVYQGQYVLDESPSKSRLIYNATPVGDPIITDDPEKKPCVAPSKKDTREQFYEPRASNPL